MTMMRVVGECFFWYRLTRVFPDKFHRAVKRLCVCVCVFQFQLVKSTLNIEFCEHHTTIHALNDFIYSGIICLSLITAVFACCISTHDGLGMITRGDSHGVGPSVGSIMSSLIAHVFLPPVSHASLMEYDAYVGQLVSHLDLC